MLLNVAVYANEQLQRVAQEMSPTSGEISAPTDTEMIQQGRDNFDRNMRSCLNALRLTDGDGYTGANEHCSKECCPVGGCVASDMVSHSPATDILELSKAPEQVAELVVVGSRPNGFSADENLEVAATGTGEVMRDEVIVVTTELLEPAVVDHEITNYGDF